jgi:hypothetical protein
MSRQHPSIGLSATVEGYERTLTGMRRYGEMKAAGNPIVAAHPRYNPQTGTAPAHLAAPPSATAPSATAPC